MIKLAKNNVPNAEFYVRDIRELDFDSGKFEVIISSFCLPYLYDHEAIEFINKISSVLKKEGLIYLSTMEGTGHNLEEASFTGGNKLFINYYSEGFLRDLFQRNKLEVVKLFKQDYPEPDGTFTTDMIFILKKSSKRN
jgi:2-polyprenyl-3-methyl-5-hydroxy-6-metoxy-1,4-benzoquinol methylase